MPLRHKEATLAFAAAVHLDLTVAMAYLGLAFAWGRSNKALDKTAEQ